MEKTIGITIIAFVLFLPFSILGTGILIKYMDGLGLMREIFGKSFVILNLVVTSVFTCGIYLLFK